MNDSLLCRRVERALADGIGASALRATDGDAGAIIETAPVSAPELEAHLATCASCRAEAERMEEVLASMEGMRDRDVPDPGEAYWNSFSSRVRAGVESAGSSSAVGPALPAAGVGQRWAWGTAAAALLAAFVWILPSGDGPPLELASQGAPDGVAPASLEFGDGGSLEGTVDRFLGGRDTFDILESVDDLSLEERQALLESLRAELEEPA